MVRPSGSAPKDSCFGESVSGYDDIYGVSRCQGKDIMEIVIILLILLVVLAAAGVWFQQKRRSGGVVVDDTDERTEHTS